MTAPVSVPDDAPCCALTYGQARAIIQSLKAGAVVFANDGTADVLRTVAAAITTTEGRARAGAFDVADYPYDVPGW